MLPLSLSSSCHVYFSVQHECLLSDVSDMACVLWSKQDLLIFLQDKLPVKKPHCLKKLSLSKIHQLSHFRAGDMSEPLALPTCQRLFLVSTSGKVYLYAQI